MDTTESNNEADRRSVTPQPQTSQSQQLREAQLATVQPHNSMSGIPGHIHSQKPSIIEPQFHRSRNQKRQEPLHNSEPPRTPSPQTASFSDSNKNGTFSNFQLPNDILKNLTPVIKSPPKDRTRHLAHAHARKQAYMRNAQLKVSTRNSKVAKQLKNWKRHQEEFIRYQSAKLTESLQRAKIRRDEYLQLVREKAVKFVNTEDGKQTSTTHEQRLEPALSIPHTSDPQFWLQEHEVSVSTNIVQIQRMIKKAIFAKHVAFLQSSSFLDKYESMPFNQIITCFNTDSSIKVSISYILKYLGLVTNVFELKMFLYCFILIADFNECMSNGPHPGFNYNSEIRTKEEEKVTTAKNCIWVMMYKLSVCLMEELKTIVDTPPKISLKFRRYWDDYKFIFKVFKWNHFVGIKHLLSSSISIVEKQISRLSGDKDLLRQRTKLNMELSLLNKYNLATLKEFNESPQAVEFLTLVSETVQELYANFDAKSPSFIQNRSSFICFDLTKFYMPDFIPIEKWRQYWMLYYFKEFETERLHPSVLKTGYLGSVRPKTRNFDYISLIDSLIDMKSFPLSQTYDVLYDYYLEFSNVCSLPRAVEEADELQKVQNLIRHYDRRNDLVQFTRSNLDNDEVLQLKYSVVIMWIQKCQFNKLDDFINFENLYTVVNLKNFKNLRYSIYTQNPSLLFPKFYKQVMKSRVLDIGTQIRDIVYASFKNNLNNLFHGKARANRGAFLLFSQVFNRMIIDKDFDNELMQIFKTNFSQFHKQLDALVRANSISIMFYSLTGTQLPNKYVKQAAHDLHTVSNKQFVQFYNNHGEKICKILYDKWGVTMKQLSRGEISVSNLELHLQAVFTEDVQGLAILSLEIHKYNQYLYKVYCPILNWIYSELGSDGDI
ncbi:hypothetical protein KGF57_002799 [Candida theae]|uniref:Uncharacterized protein n=1 Tax=Candida theae TaxID=1198502 RepID=A0AAD5FYK2_9ASCO|nr:uncharacterized protein KGF57_002799 [Candida theae]KAI5957991.1 hypothetical protein KGF57_002799 [Candida theae]